MSSKSRFLLIIIPALLLGNSTTIIFAAMPFSDEVTRYTEAGAEAIGRGLVKGAVRGLAQESRTLEHDIEQATTNLGSAAILGFAQATTNALEKNPKVNTAIHKATREVGREMLLAAGESLDHEGEQAFQKYFAAQGRALNTEFKNGGDMRQGIQTVTNTLSGSLFQVGMTGVGVTSAYYVSKYALQTAHRLYERWLFAPTLLQNTSQIGLLDTLMGKKFERKNITMVLSPEQEKELNGFTRVVKNSIARIKKGEEGVYLPNFFLQGPPGSGKTMYAEHLAHISGMDFVLINGSSLSQFKSSKEAIDEFNKLLNWKSPNKILIYFDEVDSILPNKQELSSDSITAQVINHFLGLTGAPSSEHVIGFSSNYIERIEPAVLDRCDYIMYMGFPDTDARTNLLKHFLGKTFFNKKNHNAAFIAEAQRVLNDAKVAELAARTEQYSNRSLEKFVNILYANIDPKQKLVLSDDIIEYALSTMELKKNVMEKARTYADNKKGHLKTAAAA